MKFNDISNSICIKQKKSKEIKGPLYFYLLKTIENKSRYKIILLALAYTAAASFIVEPIASNWGADYAMYLHEFEINYFIERFNVFLNSNNTWEFIEHFQLITFFIIPYGLSFLGLDASESIFLISFTSAFIISYYVIQNSKDRLFLLFLFAPILLDLLFFQIRSGLALAVFSAGVLVGREYRKLSYLFFIISILLHYSLALLFIIYFISVKFRQSGATFEDIYTSIFINKFIGIIFSALFVILTIYYYRDYVREHIFYDSSVFGLLFFLGLMLFYILNGKNFLKDFQFQYLLSIVLLFLYPAFPQTMRVFALSFPFHVVALSNAPLQNKYIIFIGLMIFLLFNISNWHPLAVFFLN